MCSYLLYSLSSDSTVYFFVVAMNPFLSLGSSYVGCFEGYFVALDMHGVWAIELVNQFFTVSILFNIFDKLVAWVF